MARQEQTQGRRDRTNVKDTYTFLINYLLLSQLRHTASELFLLLPTAVNTVLRSLTTSVIIGTTRSYARLACTSEATIACAGVLTTKACRASRLLLLEVS